MFTILKLTGTINILFFEDNKPLQYRTLQSHTHKVTFTGSLAMGGDMAQQLDRGHWATIIGDWLAHNIYHVEHFVSQSPFNPVIKYETL